MRTRFDFMDSNGDGSIDADEMEEVADRMQQMMRGGRRRRSPDRSGTTSGTR